MLVLQATATKGSTMAVTPMIVPVTPELKQELAATGRVLSSLMRDQQQPRGGLYDRQHYAEVVGTLEALAIRVLAATSSVPFTARNLPAGARFDMGAATPMAKHVTVVVAYLRDTASELLNTTLPHNQSKNTDMALSLLKQLNGLILAGIIQQAEADLEQVKTKGAVPLVAAADRLARLAASRPQPGDTEAEPVDVREASITLPRPRQPTPRKEPIMADTEDEYRMPTAEEVAANPEQYPPILGGTGSCTDPDCLCD